MRITIPFTADSVAARRARLDEQLTVMLLEAQLKLPVLVEWDTDTPSARALIREAIGGFLYKEHA